MQVAELLERLFRTYPPPANGNSEEQIRADRIERAKVYFEALAIYETRDIDAGITALLTGSEPGVNPAFAPSAPQVATAARRALNARLDSEYRKRLGHPALPPPDIPKTPESRERVRALAQQFAGAVDAMRTPDAKAEAFKRQREAASAARWDPSVEPGQIKFRLGIGDPEGHDGDMGESRRVG